MSADTDPTGIPLFPLRTVLLPGGLLPLQIFETRYVDMVKRCMRSSDPFGVVLLAEGREARGDEDEAPPSVAPIGTLAYIVDFTELPNGLLGITARGDQRFRLLRSWQQADHLLLGDVATLTEAPPLELPAEYDTLVDILRQLVEHPAVNRLGLEVDYTDAHAVSGRLADLLPIEPELKQQILETDDPLLRLAELERIVHAMRQAADADG